MVNSDDTNASDERFMRRGVSSCVNVFMCTCVFERERRGER